MILAHLPSSYLLGRAGGGPRAVMIAALIGSVAPDFDMLWFWLVDGGQTHHHRFWPHIPLVWIGIAAIALPLIAGVARRWPAPAAAFLAAILMHICLDTVNGGILWGWPFSDHLYLLVTVPATRAHWVLSFLTHWSTLAELAIIAAAALALRREFVLRPSRRKIE
ncbi:metal-dependent hydrolase [Paracoccus sp. (in: a-proteobacteria)]|uniref:metal-dependent hydrolase n=1 Tax=Paracoccus sp. TaxID=267 RepID=UPI0035AEE35E